MTLATLIGYLRGLRFVAPDLDGPTVLGTALALHVCEAIVCRLFAHNDGYPKNLWTLLGFIGGLWAVAVLIVLPRRGGGEPPAPPQLPRPARPPPRTKRPPPRAPGGAPTGTGASRAAARARPPVRGA